MRAAPSACPLPPRHEHGDADGDGELVIDLTEREVEVLSLLGEGLSNAGIGARLHLPEATVKGRVSRVLDKLGTANRTQAGLFAHEAGLVGMIRAVTSR